MFITQHPAAMMITVLTVLVALVFPLNHAFRRQQIIERHSLSAFLSPPIVSARRHTSIAITPTPATNTRLSSSSPAQGIKPVVAAGEINQMIHEASTLGRILDIVDQSFENFNEVNVITALFRIAKNTGMTGAQLLEDWRFEKLLELAVEYLEEKGTLSPFQLSNFAWSLSKLRIDDPQITSLIVREALDTISDFTPREGSNLLQAMARLRGCPPELIKAVQRNFIDNLGVASVLDVTNVLAACAALRIRDASFLSPVADRLAFLLVEENPEGGEGGPFTPLTLSNLARSLAVVGTGVVPLKRMRSLFDLMQLFAIPQLDRFDAGALCHLLFFFARIPEPENHPALYEEAKPFVTSFAERGKLTPRDLTQIAEGYGRAGKLSVDKPFVMMLAQTAMRTLGDFPPTELARFAWSMAMLQPYLADKDEADATTPAPIIQELFTGIADELLQSKSKFRAASHEELAKIAYAFGRAGVASRPLLDAISTRVKSFPDEISDRGIAHLLQAYATLDLLVPEGTEGSESVLSVELLEALTEQVVKRLKNAQLIHPDDFANILHALTRVGAFSKDLLDLAAGALLQPLDKDGQFAGRQTPVAPVAGTAQPRWVDFFSLRELSYVAWTVGSAVEQEMLDLQEYHMRTMEAIADDAFGIMTTDGNVSPKDAEMLLLGYGMLAAKEARLLPCLDTIYAGLVRAKAVSPISNGLVELSSLPSKHWARATLRSVLQFLLRVPEDQVGKLPDLRIDAGSKYLPTAESVLQLDFPHPLSPTVDDRTKGTLTIPQQTWQQWRADCLTQPPAPMPPTEPTQAQAQPPAAAEEAAAEPTPPPPAAPEPQPVKPRKVGRALLVSSTDPADAAEADAVEETPKPKRGRRKREEQPTAAAAAATATAAAAEPTAAPKLRGKRKTRAETEAPSTAAAAAGGASSMVYGGMDYSGYGELLLEIGEAPVIDSKGLKYDYYNGKQLREGVTGKQLASFWKRSKEATRKHWKVTRIKTDKGQMLYNNPL